MLNSTKSAFSVRRKIVADGGAEMGFDKRVQIHKAEPQVGSNPLSDRGFSTGTITDKY
jgi:hypothetical protein